MLSMDMARRVDRLSLARKGGRYWGVRLCARSLRPHFGYQTGIRFFRTFRFAENARRKIVWLRGSLRRRNMTVVSWSMFRLWSRWKMRTDSHGEYGFDDDVHMTRELEQVAARVEVKIEPGETESDSSSSSTTSDESQSRMSPDTDGCEAATHDEYMDDCAVSD